MQTALSATPRLLLRYDWPAMRADGGAPEVDRALRNLGSPSASTTPSTGALHFGHGDQPASQVGAISTARETWLVAAEADMPLMMWGLLVGGGLFVLVLIFVVTSTATPHPGRSGRRGRDVHDHDAAAGLALNSPFADGPGCISPRLITEAASTMSVAERDDHRSLP